MAYVRRSAWNGRCCVLPSARQPFRMISVATKRFDYRGIAEFFADLGVQVRACAPWLKLSYLAHLGNMCAVLALCTNDMLQLRCCMICASSWAIVYNVLQPNPLLAPAGWAMFFVCGHLFQIGRILRDRAQVEMTEDAVDLYESVFHPHRFRPRQFLSIMELGEVAWLEAGTSITSIGQEATDIVLILRGTADVRDGAGVLVGHIGRSQWIGNMVPGSAGHNEWNYSIIARSSGGTEQSWTSCFMLIVRSASAQRVLLLTI